VPQFSRRLLPVLAVERLNHLGLDRARIEAARVDAETVRIGARDVERLDPASATEEMARHAGVEGVFNEHLGAGEQSKTRGRDDEMPERRHRADRAVAVMHQQVRGSIDLETDCSAVTAAAVSDEVRCCCVHAVTLLPVARGAELGIDLRPGACHASSAVARSHARVRTTRKLQAITCLRDSISLALWSIRTTRRNVSAPDKSPATAASMGVARCQGRRCAAPALVSFRNAKCSRRPS
jgi:hypothetical protein